MERNDGRGHHRKLRVLLGHLVNGGIGALDRELHQVFHVGAVNLVAKRFVEYLDRCLRRNFACFRAADAVCDSEDRTLAIVQKRVFVQGSTLVQTTVRQRCGLDLKGLGTFAHCTASSFRGEELLATGLSTMVLSRAFLFENAINIPNMAKLVIRLKPPWLTKGNVIPVIGKARTIPPMFTRA